MKYIIITLLFAFPPLIDAIEPLKEDQGYLLVAFNVESGYLPAKVELDSEGLFSADLIFRDIQGNNNYWLIVADAGEYTWDKLWLSKRLYIPVAEREFKIRVEAGKINYGGQLSLYTEMNVNQNQLLGGARTYFNNKSSHALNYLIKNAPDLYNKYPVIYSGNYRDYFFEYFKSIGGEKQ